MSKLLLTVPISSFFRRGFYCQLKQVFCFMNY